MNEKSLTAIAVGFKAGGKTGYAMAEQIASVRHILNEELTSSIPDAAKREKAIDAVVATLKDSGIVNASQTRALLVKMGLLAEKVDVNTKAALAKLMA